MSYPDKIIDVLSIDCLVFGFNPNGLNVLLIEHAEGISKGQWALPGGWIKQNEGLDEAASRILSELTSINNIFLQQLRAFGEVDRYPDKRVITVAYYALIKPEDYEILPGFTASDAKWFRMDEIPSMPYDHIEILSYTRDYLAHMVKHEPIGFNLLPEKFTLLQLQSLYESFLGVKLDKPNFRRKFLKMKLLIDCREKQKDVAHRAANLYRFDEDVYNRLKEEGFNFEV